MLVEGTRQYVSCWSVMQVEVVRYVTGKLQLFPSTLSMHERLLRSLTTAFMVEGVSIGSDGTALDGNGVAWTLSAC